MILAVYGPSGSGKTTWLTKVLPELERRRVRAGAVKLCHHQAAIEPLHKDSSRMLACGARRVLLLAPGKRAVLEARTDADIDREIREFATQSDLEVVLVEGGRATGFPKIAVLNTKVRWNIPDPWPVMARIGRPPCDPAPDWTDPRKAALAIAQWLALRRRCRDVLGVILAGGNGKRLGGVKKGSLVLDGLTLLERSRRLLGAFTENVRVASPRPSEFDDSQVAVLEDAPELSGPAAGLLAAARERCDGVLILGVDQVAVSTASLDRLIRAGLPYGAAVLAPDGDPQWNVAFYSRETFPAIEEAIAAGARSLRECACAANVVPVPAPKVEARDVDTPADLHELGVARG